MILCRSFSQGSTKATRSFDARALVESVLNTAVASIATSGTVDPSGVLEIDLSTRPFSNIVENCRFLAHHKYILSESHFRSRLIFSYNRNPVGIKSYILETTGEACRFLASFGVMY